MLQHSDVTGKSFYSEDAVFFRNIVQAGFYISKGATILDVFADSEERIVIVFPKIEHRKLIKEWMDRKPKEECKRECNEKSDGDSDV